MAGTTRNCGEKTYKYSSISKLWALYKNDDPPSVEDEEEEDEQDEEEEDADDEDDDDAALFAHGTVGDAAAGDNDDKLVDDPDDDVPLVQSLSKPKKDTDNKGRNKDKAIKNQRRQKEKVRRCAFNWQAPQRASPQSPRDQSNERSRKGTWIRWRRVASS